VRTLIAMIAVLLCSSTPLASAQHLDGPAGTFSYPTVSPTEATGPAGAAVDYGTVTYSDASFTVSCDPASGATFPVGTSDVHCTADDGLGDVDSSGLFQVSVVDTQAPAISVPSDITVEAAGSSGTPVSFSATATDTVDGTFAASCSPSSGATFPITTTSVTCQATDSHGNSAPEAHFSVTVHDTAAPVITVPGDMTVAATGSSGATVTYAASATDAVAGSVAVSCSPPSGNAFPLGGTTVTCNADDGHGNSSQASFTVTVVDNTDPVVTVPGNITANADGPGGGHPTFTASATDNVDGSLTPGCSPASGSLFPFGETTVTCTATDRAGNSGSATFKVTIGDSTAPVISAPPNISGVEATGPGGAPVPYGPVTATDTVDGTIPATCSPASGSTFPIATTTVTCDAHDAHGTAAAQKTFTDTGRATQPPTITPPGDVTAEATSSAGAVVSYSAPTASDAVDGTVAANCLPASGTTFHLGDTTVTCNATDAHGNHATPKTFKVTVQDTTAPAFGAVGDRTVEANGPAGSTVNYPLPGAVDLVDGPTPVSCTPTSGTVFHLGTTLVTCHATDSHSNTATATAHMTVADTTPPTLAVPGPTNVYATTATGIRETDPGMSSFRAAATASDIVDPAPFITDDMGSSVTIGAHAVNFAAHDASGNVRFKTTSLTVLPKPPEGTAPLPPSQPAKPPADVAKLQVFPGDGSARLVWGAVAGAARYVVYRSQTSSRRLAADSHGQVVYSGTATTYTDRGLSNGVEYRYVVVAEDAAGNQSAGVAIVAVPRRNLLRSPKDGARLRKPPKLMWLRNSEAAYYNVQLFRGDVKILSTWPVSPALVLKRSWKYEGHPYKLTSGVYQWYVWPGFGARVAVDYGELLGTRSFRIVG
jgi:hypothetical protein